MSERAQKLFKEACEMCEGYSIEEQCEKQRGCPVYRLFLLAKRNSKNKTADDYRGMQGTCDFEPRLRPEMI